MSNQTNANSVDDEIYSCLDLDNPKSFFLFAGAGSGKTRSLVEVLKRFRENNIQRLRVNGQQVAIITYTNAACDEIKRRLEFDSAFNVSTIHSFVWELIKPHQSNIKEWLRENLQIEIKELEDAQRKGRAGTKAAEDRAKQISSKKKRLESLDSIRKFTYNPNGENLDRDSLNHAEVINIAANLLRQYPLLQKILVRKFPVLLVDESQDTKKELIEILFEIQGSHKSQFSLGLFGDVMQRIYSDGKQDLGHSLPSDWLKPEKTFNYRCPRRVVELINKIRSDVDDNLQEAGKSEEGFVRLFIANSEEVKSKPEFEYSVFSKMAEITGDQRWVDGSSNNKTLTLEHHMAAQRGGFSEFFNPLYKVDKLKTGLLDGSLSSITLFSERVLLLISSLESGNKFAASRIVSKYSPLMLKEELEASQQPKTILENVKSAVQNLYALWENNSDPTLLSILKELHKSKLFKVPNSLTLIAERSEENFEETQDENDINPIIDAWDNALNSKFSEFKKYVDYISDGSRFDTHQGVKGLEFPRVTVILDDDEARGFLFSYDKLFGVKEPSATDIKNQNEGRETGIDRTRRLFYVACSRAEESLAVIAYTNNPQLVKNHALNKGWFAESEIIICDNELIK